MRGAARKVSTAGVSVVDILTRLQEIAARIATAPATTEEAARRNLAQRRAENPEHAHLMTYHAHQSGALEQVCRSAAGDIEALIKRLAEEGIAS